jgi:hypothetical protein
MLKGALPPDAHIKASMDAGNKKHLIPVDYKASEELPTAALKSTSTLSLIVCTT